MIYLQEKRGREFDSENKPTTQSGGETQAESSHDISQAGGRQSVDEDRERRTEVDKGPTAVGKHTIVGRII